MVKFNSWQPQRPQNLQQNQTTQRSQPGVPKSPQAAAKLLAQQLASNPSLMRSIGDKFKIDASREASGVDSLGMLSGRGEGVGEGTALSLGSSVRLKQATEMAPRLRRAEPGALRQIERIAPALGGAAGSAEVSGAVGEAAGLPGHRKGAGVLGAMAKKLGLGASGDSSSSRQPEAAARKSSNGVKSPAAFFLNTVQLPNLVSSAPSATPRRTAASTPEAAGKRLLTETLQQGKGKIAEFLRDSSVGKMLRSVDGLQEALGVRASQRMKMEQYFLKF